ncbi:MAG: bifunctional glutamate N-acetyltransferase/amino-acid acetyltransferase ArgJ [Nevskiaceae bacterium]|nr:MAG: bifunctional glutamate N-acetyltransferase/amino-acid acetyltransferase ArgJ [Nevskiaceae bacterium]TBR73395.1 MAG: bifunctional glutamate N-acetyltransferase/amino-acid acetyltransferase ArgJ [Nevskiaceae bacterium]
MPVNLQPPVHLLPVPGVRLGVADAAIKHAGRNDLMVVELAAGSRVAGVFTRNAFAAAPVHLCRERLAAGAAVRGLVFNSGNANAATGSGGLEDARRTTAAVAQALGVAADAVLPFSTGVIGQRLPLARMIAAIPAAAADLRADAWLDAARAIMTTDTVPKGASRQVTLSDGSVVAVTGIAKGVGMICPDMGTTLSFIATDARLTAAAVQQCLHTAVAGSFNSITVDGDTSTNDSCVLAATARSGGAEIDTASPDYVAVAAAIAAVCLTLAQAMVRDGEGASKFIAIDVGGGRNLEEVRKVAYSIAHSPLVKTALYAGDANWGRIVMAIGKAGVEALDPATVDVALDDVPLIHHGEPHPGYAEDKGAAVVGRKEFTIHIGLGRGPARTTVWTCDLGHDYVKINAEYRT